MSQCSLDLLTSIKNSLPSNSLLPGHFKYTKSMSQMPIVKFNQKLLINSQVSDSIDVPAGCMCVAVQKLEILRTKYLHAIPLWCHFIVSNHNPQMQSQKSVIDKDTWLITRQTYKKFILKIIRGATKVHLDPIPRAEVTFSRKNRVIVKG